MFIKNIYVVAILVLVAIVIIALVILKICGTGRKKCGDTSDIYDNEKTEDYSMIVPVFVDEEDIDEQEITPLCNIDNEKIEMIEKVVFIHTSEMIL